MSEWKYVRKKNLRDYADLTFATGIFLGGAIGTLPFSVPLTVAFLIASALLWSMRRQFDRVRKAINNAGGEDL